LASAKERLRRLLLVVPYVVSHPGVELKELSRSFQVPVKDLTADLDLLFLTGVPPFGPGDLIGVDIEDGRVWLSMADHLSRPLRLTRPEAISLYLRGEALLGIPGLPEATALRSALQKIEDGLGAEALGNLRGRVEPAASDAGGEMLERVRRAASEHESIDIEYYSASRDEMALRRVDPEAVFSALGYWYAVAWDGEAGGERMFRVDRIRFLTGTGDYFEARGLEGAGRQLYAPSDSDIRVRLLLRPGARWVAEYYPAETCGERGPDLEVCLPTRSLAWVAKLVVRLGSQVEVLEPVELSDMAQALASRTLALYG